MILLFTASNKIGSRLIRWATGETVSHVAVLFYGEIVAHMSFSGFKLQMLTEFTAEHTVVAQVVLSRRSDQEAAAAVSKFRASGRGGYDYVGIVGYAALLLWRRIWCDSTPVTKIPFQDPTRHMCTEFAAEILGTPRLAVMTPQNLYERVIRWSNATPYG